jgi:asparagine synthase (glutamine-hydrolysing)
LLDQQVIDPAFVLRSKPNAPRREVWDKYVGFYNQNLDYHLWHEDRTSSAHSNESRVPFLDHRIIEFLSQVPLRHHVELFTDKRILRRAANGWLPPEIAERPKGPFFYGREQRFTFKLVYSVLTANNGELIEQAIAGSCATDGALNSDQFRRYAMEVGRDPELKELNQLIYLVNMGVLADMAHRQQVPATRSGPLPVYEVEMQSRDYARPY